MVSPLTVLCVAVENTHSQFAIGVLFNNQWFVNAIAISTGGGKNH
jgi:hypothetical protein